MKKILLAVLIVTGSLVIAGQAPESFNYQVIPRNNSNGIYPEQTMTVKISILAGNVSGDAVFIESFSKKTTELGLINLQIGTGILLSGDFSSIQWGSNSYFLKVEIDPAGGSNFTEMGITQLISVPYAMYSKSAGTVTETDPLWSSVTDDYYTKINMQTAGQSQLNWANITNKPQGNQTGEIQYWDGSNWLLLPPGQPGQFLQLSTSGLPSWGGASYPTVITTLASSITNTTATSGGNVISDGEGVITERGVCWNTLSSPTIADNKSSNGGGTGEFTCSMTGLYGNTTYHVRAYATNSAGTSYGNEIIFMTLPPLLPQIATKLNSFTSSGATSGGTISNDGGAYISAKGVCWSTSPNPSITDNLTDDGSGNNEFTSSLTGLTKGTIYYIRAYATNSAGTGYGDELIFRAISIGDDYAGGKVAYILPGNIHGYIVAPTDQSTGAQWGCYGTSISTSTDSNMGEINTSEITSHCTTAGIAAKLCQDLIISEFSDWYLPSLDQLYSIYGNRTAIGGFANNVYWTSSQYDANNAWYLLMGDGYSMYFSAKNLSYYVRAVRNF